LIVDFAERITMAMPPAPVLGIPSFHWEGMVDPNVLEIPREGHLLNIWKDRAAIRLDKSLRNVSRTRAFLEREIGKRLAILRDTGGLIKLGFARLADYAEECHELGCRTAQEMARTGAALEALPLLRQAHDEARISSSKVRELVRVVTPENEAEWLERAASLTVRGLREEIRRRRLEEGGDSDEREVADEDAPPRFRLPAPPWFHAKCACAVDRFRKVEGGDRPPVRAALEAFAAEWRSSVPDEPGGMADSGSTHRDLPEGADVGSFTDRKTARPPSTRETRDEAEKSLEECSERWAYLNVNDGDPPNLPDWLEVYNRDAPAAPLPPFAPDPFATDEEITEMVLEMRLLDGLTGRMLLTMARTDLFRPMQFLDIAHYARERLGMGASTARRLKWVERQIYDHPELGEAYYAGRIGLAKVRPLLRVRQAKDFRAWIERAKGITVRRLEREVNYVLRRGALIESGLLPHERGEDPYKVLPEGMDLERSTSALDDLALKGPKQPEPSRVPLVTIRCTMEPDLLRFWDECAEHCRKLFGRNLLEWECANRFVDAFLEAHDRRDPYCYVLSHKVFERDGWRCTVPGCTSRGRLHAHHIRARSRGGSNDLSNLTTLCTMHHLRAVHEGWVDIEGTAPDHLTWRLGVARDGQARLTIGPGERVISGLGLPCSPETDAQPENEALSPLRPA
jgi:hypothetical protein